MIRSPQNLLIYLPPVGIALTRARAPAPTGGLYGVCTHPAHSEVARIEDCVQSRVSVQDQTWAHHGVMRTVHRVEPGCEAHTCIFLNTHFFRLNLTSGAISPLWPIAI